MSLVAHLFGHVEFGNPNICYCFLQAGAVEKIKTNIRNSTHPNFCGQTIYAFLKPTYHVHKHQRSIKGPDHLGTTFIFIIRPPLWQSLW